MFRKMQCFARSSSSRSEATHTYTMEIESQYCRAAILILLSLLLLALGVQGDTEAKFVPIGVKSVLNKMLAYCDPAPFYFPKGKGIEALPDALIALSTWLSEKE
ncbi:hypothetical protein H5410_004560 [Solanum commersonii]|uniref:Uncharacterized protein n=1 Tax=Solanum commersonii TaxID=4109 RepID=A0A9J6B8C2_SOLCO|nr:hypothetical protein H5410_004560 [Solanum commersonii]